MGLGAIGLSAGGAVIVEVLGAIASRSSLGTGRAFCEARETTCSIERSGSK